MLYRDQLIIGRRTAVVGILKAVTVLTSSKVGKSVTDCRTARMAPPKSPPVTPLRAVSWSPGLLVSWTPALLELPAAACHMLPRLRESD